MVNDIPISQNKLDSEHISVTPLKEKYEYEYDSDGRLISAIVPASRDIPKFKFRELYTCCPRIGLRFVFYLLLQR